MAGERGSLCLQATMIAGEESAQKRERGRRRVEQPRQRMTGVAVRCRVQSVSASGKAPGRPRLLGDVAHAESVSAAGRKRVHLMVTQCMSVLQDAVERCEKVQNAVHQVLALPEAELHEAALHDVRYALNCCALGLLESYHALQHATEYAHQNKVLAAALCSQALEVRHSILPALVRARRVDFKRGGGAESNSAAVQQERAGEGALQNALDGGDSDMVREEDDAELVTVDDSSLHAEARRDSCEVLSRSKIRRTRATQLRAHAHELKTQRRRELNIHGELKYSGTPEARQRLLDELRDVVNSGPVFREREHRHARLRRHKLARSRQMFLAGAFANCSAADHPAIPADRLQRYKEHLARIRARAFPERNAPNLQGVGEQCMYVATAMDTVDSLLCGLASRVRLEGDRAGVAMAALDAACASSNTQRIRVLLQTGVLDQFAAAARDVLQYGLASVTRLCACAATVDSVQLTLQQWYNHGEGGLKTAFCARDASAVQVYARGNVPLLGDMHRFSMLHGVRRVVNRDDETVPLPSSSFSAARTLDSSRERKRAKAKQSASTVW